MSNVISNIVNLGDIKQGEFLDRLNAEIHKAAKDIRNREHVSAKRKIQCTVEMHEEEGITHIEFEVKSIMPPAPKGKGIAFTDRQGNLVSSTDAEEIMHQPKLQEVPKKKAVNSNA